MKRCDFSCCHKMAGKNNIGGFKNTLRWASQDGLHSWTAFKGRTYKKLCTLDGRKLWNGQNKLHWCWSGCIHQKIYTISFLMQVSCIRKACDSAHFLLHTGQFGLVFFCWQNLLYKPVQDIMHSPKVKSRMIILVLYTVFIQIWFSSHSLFLQP